MSNLGYISWKMWLERLRLGLVKDHIFVSRKSSFFFMENRFMRNGLFLS